MRFARLLALLSLFLLSAAPARAVDETDFCAGGADPCEFNGDPLTIDADTTLDFGSRTVIIGELEGDQRRRRRAAHHQRRQLHHADRRSQHRERG